MDRETNAVETRTNEKGTRASVDWTLVIKNFKTTSDNMVEQVARMLRTQDSGIGPRMVHDTRLSSIVSPFRKAQEALLDAIDELTAETRQLREDKKVLNDRLNQMARANLGKD